MVRKAQNTRQSLNSSVLTVNNNSVLEVEKSFAEVDVSYHEFVKRFQRSHLSNPGDLKLVGYNATIAEIRGMFHKFLNNQHSKRQFRLITGPPRTGKTCVIKKLAHEFATPADNQQQLSFFYLKASWIVRKKFGDPDSRITSLFDEAIQKAPSVIFIDEIHLIASEKRSQNDDKIFQLLMDELESLVSIPSARVLVLAATDRPEMLDRQMRKTCYFSKEIKFSLPSRTDRAEYLNIIIANQRQQQQGKCENGDLEQEVITGEQVEFIADRTHCCSYEDLTDLCELGLSLCEDSAPVLTFEALKAALKVYKPFVIRSITTPHPPLHWSDIGGVDTVKRELQESVIWPLQHRAKFQAMGAKSNKGALLYGPPGCSKTMLAQALATESGFNFIAIKGPELNSKYVGDTEAAVRKLYRNAREIAPCIIFFDEIDGFAPNRSDNQSSSVCEKVVATLLPELDGIDPLNNVFTIAATNRPDRVEPALLRPGRLNPAIYIPLPSEHDRAQIFLVHLRPLRVSFADGASLEEAAVRLASQTAGYSGADIASVCLTSAKLALRESLDNESVQWQHLQQALATVQPSTRPELLRAYDLFNQRSLREATGTNAVEPPPTPAPAATLDQRPCCCPAAVAAAAAASAAASAAQAAAGQPSVSSTPAAGPKPMRLNRLMRSLSISSKKAQSSSSSNNNNADNHK